MHEIVTYNMFKILMLLCATMIYAGATAVETCSGIVQTRNRTDRISITDFGGVGDGITVNTQAFRDSINSIQSLRSEGGTLLFVPPGVHLTDRFNLTSHMTLYLASGAVIKATQDTSNWPLADPLPSYGRGRERSGGRYMSFILGDGLHDVVITGDDGTIEGQGDIWWKIFKTKTLKYTRPHLLEFMYSTHITISNLVFNNSPFWNIHPVYCSNVVVRYVTILAPYNSPNTDGVDSDSSSNVCIEDSYISNADDMVAVKSGWDKYGLTYGHPSSNITVRRITGSSRFAGIAVGSEISGGIENLLFEHINLTKMGIGIHIKTNIGRGSYIRNITISDVYVQGATKGIQIAGDKGGHPDDNFDPNALPIVRNIEIKNVKGENIRQPGRLKGIENAPFTNIFLWNVKFIVTKTRAKPWQCSDVKGWYSNVSSLPCSELIETPRLRYCNESFLGDFMSPVYDRSQIYSSIFLFFMIGLLIYF